MEKNLEGAPAPHRERRVVHCWDTQTRKILCGEPGQIGATKHIHDVTCRACLDIISRGEQAVPAATS